jgi:putative hydrolase of the HAD superfamily
MIEAVLFDLFETLVTESGLAPTRASTLATVLGVDETRYRVAWKARRPRVVLGQMSFADALTEICETATGRVDARAIERIRQQRVQEKLNAYRRIDDAVTALVGALADRGVHLGVVSNGFAEDVLAWPTCQLAHRFQSTAFSCAEGIAKPDPEIYLRVVRRLNARPATTLFIGDGGDDELAGAERAGLRAFRAAWFVKRSLAKVTQPELTRCTDALTLIASG